MAACLSESTARGYFSVWARQLWPGMLATVLMLALSSSVILLLIFFDNNFIFGSELFHAPLFVGLAAHFQHQLATVEELGGGEAEGVERSAVEHG